MKRSSPEFGGNQEEVREETARAIGFVAAGNEVVTGGILLGYAEEQWVADKISELIDKGAVPHQMSARFWNLINKVRQDHIRGLIVSPGKVQEHYAFLMHGPWLNLDSLEAINAQEPISLRHKNAGLKIDEIARFLVASRYAEIDAQLAREG